MKLDKRLFVRIDSVTLAWLVENSKEQKTNVGKICRRLIDDYKQRSHSENTVKNINKNL